MNHLPSTARNEQVSLEPEVSRVPEICAIQNGFSGWKDKNQTRRAYHKGATKRTRQLDILVLNLDEVPVLAQL